MGTKPDIKNEATLTWDRFKDKAPDAALAQIYQDTHAASKQKREWYWTSIKTKRWTSLGVRFMAFSLLLAGTVLPLLAGLSDNAATRLRCTQIAVTLLASAGLLQIADKVFGWSTGWMRYITTATAMEAATTGFELAWSKHLVSKTGALDATDVQALYPLAEGLERELIKLQTDETNGWIAEFNSGLSLLDAAIKAQREQTQSQLEALRTTVANAQAAARAEDQAKTDAAAAAAKAKADADAAAAKARQPGAIEVAMTFKSGPRLVSLSVDGATPQEFLGSVWSMANLSPGLHTVEVRTLADPKESNKGSVVVEPGRVAKHEVKFSL